MFCNKAIKTKDVLDYGLAIYILKCILRQKQFMEIHNPSIKFWKLWLFFFLLLAGSVFVDCGLMASYVDSITNISWVPDAPEYITTGVNGYVPSAPSIYPNNR
jgi:hypothetical protein